jgi:hypothetical protein
MLFGMREHVKSPLGRLHHCYSHLHHYSQPMNIDTSKRSCMMATLLLKHEIGILQSGICPIFEIGDGNVKTCTPITSGKVHHY